MADAIIQIPPDSTGKMLDTEQVTVGANDVQRQRVQLAGAGAADIATITDGKLDVNAASDALTDDELRATAVPVVDTNSADILAALEAIQTAVEAIAAAIITGPISNAPAIRTTPDA